MRQFNDGTYRRLLITGLGPALDSSASRKARIFHDCFRHLLTTWDEKTRDAKNIVWADQKRRQTRFFLGGLLGDQQVTLTWSYSLNEATCHLNPLPNMCL